MRIVVATSLATTLAFSTVSAQRVYQGFWISLAPGGAGIVHKEGLAYPLYVRLGGTINQRLLVGIEWYGIVLDAEPPSGATNLTAMALLYPSHKGVLFTKAGLGIGRRRLAAPTSTRMSLRVLASHWGLASTSGWAGTSTSHRASTSYGRERNELFAPRLATPGPGPSLVTAPGSSSLWASRGIERCHGAAEQAREAGGAVSWR